MYSLEMDDIYALKIYRDGNKIRLTITENSLDLACRKESKKKLLELLIPLEEHLFNGRLQLILSNSEVFVQLKEVIKGKVDKRDLILAIQSL